MFAPTQDQQLDTIIAWALAFVAIVAVVMIFVKLLQLVPWLVILVLVAGAGYVMYQNSDNMTVGVMQRVMDREFQNAPSPVIMVNGLNAQTLNRLKSYRPLNFEEVSDQEFTFQKRDELAKKYPNQMVIARKYRITVDEKTGVATVTVAPLGERWYEYRIVYDKKNQVWV